MRQGHVKETSHSGLGFRLVFSDLWFFLLIFHSLCTCAQAHGVVSCWNTKPLDVNSSFELIHLHWKPRDWNYYCCGLTEAPSSSRSSGFHFPSSSSFSHIKLLIYTVHKQRGVCCLRALGKSKLKLCMKSGFYLRHLLVKQTLFFPPHHKREWNPTLNHQKSSILITQICVATIHTGQFNE